MRIFLTGASGFVGSNLAARLRAATAPRWSRPTHAELDLTDAARRVRAVAAARARTRSCTRRSSNDPAATGCATGARAWDGYVGATRNVVDAANAAGAHVVLVSTDWVFDGTQGPRDRETSRRTRSTPTASSRRRASSS